MSLRPFLDALPKTETHLHIEGALPFPLLQRIEPELWRNPPASWAGDFKFRDFPHFENELLGMCTRWYNSPERYFEAAEFILTRLYREQQVRYVETSFASGVVEFLGLDGQAIAQAIKQAAPAGLEVRVFLGIHHGGYNERTRDWLEACVYWPELDGLDLHGMETDPMGDWAPALWAKARALGKLTKAHAGEFAGPDFVRYVVEQLGVRRIEHGVRSAEDSALVDELIALGVTLDVCPISNVKLDVVPTMAAHPIRQFFDRGLRCTINTDDPISFGNQLHEEYEALHTHLGFTIPELGQIAKNGFEIALLPEATKAAYLAEIDAVVARFA